MPNLLRKHPHAKAIKQERSLDGVGVVALAVGFSGLLLAAIVYLTVGDKFLVSYIMVVSAAVVALVLRWDVDPREPG